MRQKGWRGLEWKECPSPSWDKSLTKFCFAFFLLESRSLLQRRFWCIHNNDHSPPQSLEGIFLRSSLSDSGRVGFPEGKPIKGWEPPLRLWPLEFPTLTLLHSLVLAIHQNYHLSVPTSLWFQQLLFLADWPDLGYVSGCSHLSRF